MAKKNKSAVPVSVPSTGEATPMVAVKAGKNDGFKVLETIDVSPAQLVFTESFRGRVKPVSEEIQVDRADSIRRNGQQQPIQVRKSATEEGKYEVVFGNTRGFAGLKILNGYTNGDGKEVKPDAGFKLRAEVVDVDDETAFLRNVVENAQRTATSPTDNAHNQQKLREQYGMSDAMITKHYGYSSQASVSRLKKLLDLEEEYQNSTHDGTMTQGAAFLLADIEKGKPRQKVWLKAVDKSKGEDAIGSAAMIQAIKEYRKEAKEATTPTGGTEGGAEQPTAPATGEASAPVPAGPGRPASENKSLTLKEIKDVWKEIGADVACPAVVEQAMSMLLGFVEGKTDAKDFAQWFASNLIGGDITPEAAKPEVSAEDSFDADKNPRDSDEPTA